MNNKLLTLTKVPIYLGLIILFALCVFPLYILIINATRSAPQIQQGITMIPGSNLLVNWNTLNNKGFAVQRGFFNSAFIAICTTILSVYFSLLCAYALQVYNFRFKEGIKKAIWILVLLPSQIAIVGFYQYMSVLKLLNSYIPLIIPAIAAPATIFFALQYLESAVVPELISAARIDGCSELAIFNRVMMPIFAPGAFTMGIFAFVGSWNNYFTPFILLSKLKLYTLPMLVQTLRGNVYGTEFGAIYLGLALSIIPIMIVYAIFSRYIIGGMSMGAVKE